MIRFIDITKDYWALYDPGAAPQAPRCAFVDPADRFAASPIDGCQVFCSLDEVHAVLGEHYSTLVPEGFFDKPTTEEPIDEDVAWILAGDMDKIDIVPPPTGCVIRPDTDHPDSTVTIERADGTSVVLKVGELVALLEAAITVGFAGLKVGLSDDPAQEPLTIGFEGTST